MPEIKEVGSAPGWFSWTDWPPVLQVVVIAAAGAAFTYVNENIASWDLGAWTPAVQAGWTTFAAVLARLGFDTRKKVAK